MSTYGSPIPRRGLFAGRSRFALYLAKPPKFVKRRSACLWAAFSVAVSRPRTPRHVSRKEVHRKWSRTTQWHRPNEREPTSRENAHQSCLASSYIFSEGVRRGPTALQGTVWARKLPHLPSPNHRPVCFLVERPQRRSRSPLPNSEEARPIENNAGRTTRSESSSCAELDRFWKDKQGPFQKSFGGFRKGVLSREGTLGDGRGDPSVAHRPPLKKVPIRDAARLVPVTVHPPNSTHTNR